MGLPTIPCVTQSQSLTNLLESIALEETALAAFVNAEAEKIQAVAAQMACKGMDNDEVICFQKSVTSVLQTAIKMQMLLQFKLENVLEAKLKLECEDLCDDKCEVPCKVVCVEECNPCADECNDKGKGKGKRGKDQD